MTDANHKRPLSKSTKSNHQPRLKSNQDHKTSFLHAQTIHEDLSTIHQDPQAFVIYICSALARNKNVHDDDEIVERAETVRSAWSRG
jgi:hypothetical protein